MVTSNNVYKLLQLFNKNICVPNNQQVLWLRAQKPGHICITSIQLNVLLHKLNTEAGSLWILAHDSCLPILYKHCLIHICYMCAKIYMLNIFTSWLRNPSIGPYFLTFSNLIPSSDRESRGYLVLVSRA